MTRMIHQLNESSIDILMCGMNGFNISGV